MNLKGTTRPTLRHGHCVSSVIQKQLQVGLSPAAKTQMTSLFYRLRNSVPSISRRWLSASTNPDPSVTANDKLLLSDTCVKKIQEICPSTDAQFLRVTVDGGGCSGFQYKFELDSTLKEDDIALGPNSKIVVDTVSLEYCAGSTLDYQTELIKSGFRIVGNPKAEQGCSCGASFALKIT